MIAADSSSLIAYLDGETAWDTDAIEAALQAQDLYLPPPVIVELLGGDDDQAYAAMVSGAHLVPLVPGCWQRARVTRRLLRARGLKARAIDALIAQCCIDAAVPLITRDADFRHFAQHCGLKLATP